MENKNKTLIAGALIGAVTGLLAAMLLQRSAEKNERETAITTGEGLETRRAGVRFVESDFIAR